MKQNGGWRGAGVLTCLMISAVLGLGGQGGAAAAAAAGNSTPGGTAYPGGGMRRVAGLNTDAGELVLASAVLDTAGGYAYFGTNSSPGVVVKVRLSDFTRVGALTLNPGEGGLFSAAIDPAGGYAYFGSFDYATYPLPPGKVVKVRLSDFTRVGALTLNAGEVGIGSAVIDPAGGYAYFGTRSGTGVVVKVRLSDFTRAGSVTLNSGESNLSCAALDAAGGFAYFGIYTAPGKVVKVRLSDMTRVGALTLNTGENALSCAVLDAAGGYAYFGTSDDLIAQPPPGYVVKVRLSDMTRVGALTLDAGNNAVNGAVIDPAGGYAYFGLNEPHRFMRAKVAKVRLADFTQAGTLTLNSGENSINAMVYDPAAGAAYLAGSTYQGVIPTLSQGEVIKVALSEAGAIHANRIAVGEAGNVRDLRFYSHLAAGNLRLALYNDASPRQLLWQSGSVANTAAGDWLSVPVTAGSPGGMALHPGSYWLAWQADSGGDVPSYAAGAAGGGFTLDQAYGAFPATLDEGKINPNSELWSEYLTTGANAAQEWGKYR